MDFAFSEDQELLRSTTRKFLESRHPIAAVRARLDDDVVFDRDVWREGASLGWTAMFVPAAYEGGSISSQPEVDLAGLAEELGRQLYPGPFLATNVVADLIARDGTEAQHKRHLPSIASGDLVAAWCTTGDGSVDPEAIDVRVIDNGNCPRLDGAARFVQDAHIADLLLASARDHHGTSLLLLPAGARGVTVRLLRSIDLTRRLCEVQFDQVELDEASVLGTRGAADASLTRGLQLATVLQSAEAVGAAQRVFEMTVQYSRDRVQFGRQIGSFQAIKHRLSDLFIEMEAARAAARYAALALADGHADCDEALAVAGSYVRDAFAHICGEALQLHGGIGFTWEHDVHLFLRRAKTDQVLFGAPSLHRERLVSILEQRVQSE